MSNFEQNTPKTLVEESYIKSFLKIGLLSFGGPAAQIALMHKILVDEKKWLNEKQFLNALNFCMLLPGPEAMQLATFCGWRIGGTWLGLWAGLLFILPGALVIAILGALYGSFGSLPISEALFLGIKATVIIIVLQALIKLSKKTLHKPLAWAIALFAFIGLFFMSLPYPLIIFLAGLIGYFAKNSFAVPQALNDSPRPKPLTSADFKASLITALKWLGIWILPLLVVSYALPQPIWAQISLFFSKLAIVTFGGAYAVLAYMAQDVVAHYGWLTTPELMDGLGLAETTPGPLILVTEFIGFLAVFKQYGLVFGLLAALVTLWATFAPCFMWVFVGAPYIERLTHYPRLYSTLSAITAAVVGGILNLSLWFALNTLFKEVLSQNFGFLRIYQPVFSSIDIWVLILTCIAGVIMMKFKRDILTTLAIMVPLGVLAYFIPL